MLPSGRGPTKSSKEWHSRAQVIVILAITLIATNLERPPPPREMALAQPRSVSRSKAAAARGAKGAWHNCENEQHTPGEQHPLHQTLNLNPTCTLRVCRIIAFYRYWAIILLTFEGLGKPSTLNPKP